MQATVLMRRIYSALGSILPQTLQVAMKLENKQIKNAIRRFSLYDMYHVSAGYECMSRHCKIHCSANLNELSLLGFIVPHTLDLIPELLTLLPPKMILPVVFFLNQKNLKRYGHTVFAGSKRNAAKKHILFHLVGVVCNPGIDECEEG